MTIKVHYITTDMMKVKKVDAQEATALLEEAYAQGAVVIDKETGGILDEFTFNTKEIFMVEVIAGVEMLE